ncbi:kinase-like domain-containing protein [Rhizophagus diaphanus]|nr:kinase-like domain-containing protein [Rhizophagus diaphanus] [Rhizophagus sp. MUCL 43196]
MVNVKDMEKCSECDENYTKKNFYYCNPCNLKHFRNNFAQWTSGDLGIDKLIQNSQLNATFQYELIEWIEYSNLENVEFIAEGGNKEVAIKKIRNATSVSSEFLSEIRNTLMLNFAAYCNGIYGVTRDPHDNEYAIVMKFQNLGYGKYISPVISDFGLCRPAGQVSADKILYGVLPFVAPEVLRGEEFTEKSDVYRFGMVMSEIISGEVSYVDRDYDLHLVLDICKGERPRIPEYTPEPFKALMNRCWDPTPTKRPTAQELYRQIRDWDAIIKEFSQEKENRWKAQLSNLSTNPHPSKMSQNRFTSKLLDFSTRLISATCNIRQSECLSTRITTGIVNPL